MVASLAELLTVNTAECGDRIALTSGRANISWSELSRRAHGVAVALAAADVEVQGRVLYLGRNSLSYFDVLYGAALADVIFVPLNWRLSARELAAIVDDTAATVLITEPAFAELADEVLAVLARPDSVVMVATDPGALAVTNWAPPTGSDRGTRATAGDHVAFQLYTSGTTGLAKGAMFANDTNVKALLELVSAKWDLRADDVSLATLPLFHMGGLAWALAGMARQSRLVLVDFDAEVVLDVCAAERVSTTFFVPAMLPPLIAAARGRQRTLHIRRLMYSGAPVAPHVLIEAMTQFDCDFAQIYGMTEATGAFAQLDPADHDPGGPRQGLLRSAGRAYPWVEVIVAEPTTGQALPAGETGEVWTRSVQNMFGYFERPEEMAATMTADGWLRTGDIGYLDPQGYLFLLDRRKDVIITGGENVYPVEVENILSAHPDIAEVAVIGAPDPQWGETVVAVVVPVPGRALDPEQIIDWARERLASFKCPRRLEIRDCLPRTATGKIRKDRVREPFWSGYDRRIN